MPLANTVDQVEFETNLVAFSKTLPKLQLYWDSVSSGAFKKCKRFYQYSILDGYQSLGSNSHLEFGIFLHSCVEVYHRAIHVDKLGHEAALRATIRHALLITWDSKRNRPWTSDEPTKTRDTLLRTLVVYLDRSKDDSLETIVLADGEPAIEMGFRFSLRSLVEEGEFFASTGEEFYLCGRVDRGAIWNGQTWTPDIKTTKYALDDKYFAQYSPNNQVSIYSVAGRVVLQEETAGVIIDGIQLLVNGSRFYRKPINRSTEQLVEWLIEFQMMLQEADLCAQRNYWPMNDTACGIGNMQCPYRPACALDPSARQDFLDTHYERRYWNPLERPTE